MPNQSRTRPADTGLGQPPTLHIRVEVADEGREVLLLPRGDLCVSTVSLLHRELELVTTSSQLARLNIDFIEVTSLDSSAIATLSVFARRCEQANLQLGLSNLSESFKSIATLMPREVEPPTVVSSQKNAFECNRTAVDLTG